MDKTYVETVRLLLEAAPFVFQAQYFAMKGGTAINLFIQDLPRLSVDIDVVYTDHVSSRPEAVQAIGNALATIQKQLERWHGG